MKHIYVFAILSLGLITLFSSCAKYDYHSQVEITDESQQLDMHSSEKGAIKTILSGNSIG